MRILGIAGFPIPKYDAQTCTWQHGNKRRLVVVCVRVEVWSTDEDSIAWKWVRICVDEWNQIDVHIAVGGLFTACERTEDGRGADPGWNENCKAVYPIVSIGSVA